MVAEQRPAHSSSCLILTGPVLDPNTKPDYIMSSRNSKYITWKFRQIKNPSSSSSSSSSMDYDYRNRVGSNMYRPTSSSSSPMYSRAGQTAPPPPAGRGAPYHHQPSSAPPSSGLGIKVVIKPDYLITPPPQLAPQMPEVPRSTFQFDFEFEKKILAEAEKDTQNWSRFSENQSTKIAPSTSAAPAGDPVVDKYVASGLGREAVSLAVKNYGDHPVKVREFVKGYNLLREMGFSSKSVAEALAMYDNDTDKALAHFLNSST